MSGTARVFLSLGGNLGDRESNLRRAIRLLKGSLALREIRVSSIYETEPQELRAQPWFLNCVVEFETAMEPLALLNATRRVEFELGRNRNAEIPKGPRIIDIDILLFGDRIVGEPELRVPHPRMTQRRFVLEPLLELDSEIFDPVTRLPLKQYLPGVLSQRVRIGGEERTVPYRETKSR